MVSSLTVGYSHNVAPLAKRAAVRRRGDFFEAGWVWGMRGVGVLWKFWRRGQFWGVKRSGDRRD